MASQTVTLGDQVLRTVCTPSLQASTSHLKIVRLLELGVNDKGRFARVEFEDESARPLYLLSVAEAWHDIFSSLEWSDRWAIRRHYNDRFPEPTLSDGSKKKFKYASFTTETYSRRRKYLASNDFDLDAYKNIDGYQAGLLVAIEFLDLQSISSGRYCVSLSRMLFDIASASGPHAADARRAFMLVMDDMVRFAAKHCAYRGFIEQELARAEQCQEIREKREAEERAAFVQRMKAAKEAKRRPTNTATLVTAA
jgi:hypothetical protein